MNDQELYEIMLEKGFAINTINQVLKAREAGYDIYTPDIHISNEKLRDFRHFVMEKFEPVFDQGQLREIQIGYIKGLDISLYADEKYSYKEMELLRKLIEHDSKDIDLLKEYSYDYQSMLSYYKAIRNGLTRIDFETYDLKTINFINKYLSKKIDLREYLSKGFNLEQSEELVDIKDKFKIDLSSYLTKKYRKNTFIEYAKILEEYEYDKVKILFNTEYNCQQLEKIIELMKDNKHQIDDFLRIVANEKYSTSKMELLNNLFLSQYDKKTIDAVKEYEYPDDNKFFYLNSFYLHNRNFDLRLLSDDVNVSYLKEIWLKKNLNMDFFFKMIKNDINPNYVEYMLKMEDECMSIEDYVDKHTTPKEFDMYVRCMKYIKEKNLWKYEKFIMENINERYKLNILNACVCDNLDFQNLNFKLTESQLRFIINNYPNNLELSKDISCSKDLSQMIVLLEAKSKGINTNNLLIPNLEPFKYKFILQLEKYNKEHERQVNIKDIALLDCDIRVIGPIVSDLISDDLDRNLNAYKKISEIKKNNIERNIEKER